MTQIYPKTPTQDTKVPMLASEMRLEWNQWPPVVHEVASIVAQRLADQIDADIVQELDNG